MGFEPTTFCLGSKHSTTELRPLRVGPLTTTIIASRAPTAQRNVTVQYSGNDGLSGLAGGATRGGR